MRTLYRQQDGYFAEDILQSAIDHFFAAKKLMEIDACCFDSAGYLFQLSIELMMKAWAFHLNGEFDGTHSLSLLRQRLIESGVHLQLTKDENQAIDRISSLYELRYPNRLSPTEVGDDELTIASRIIEVIWQALPDELVLKYEAIPFGRKGNRVLMERKDKEVE